MQQDAGGGASVSDHLKAAARKGRIKLKEPPHLPPGTAYLWNDFVRMSRRRRNNGFGPEPLSYEDIRSYAYARAITFADWELDAIEALDDAFIDQVRKGAS